VREVIRPIQESEFPEFVRVLEQAAGRHMTAESLEDARRAYPVDRCLAVVADGAIVGGTSSDVLQLTVCGPAVVPVARATLTGVLATQRGRGLAAALLTRQLHDMRQAGEVFAVASTSTPGLLTALSYAPASRTAAIELRPADIRLDPRLRDSAGTIRVLAPDGYATQLPPVFDRHRVRQPGQVYRPAEFWRTWLLDRPLYRIGSGPRFAIVYEDGDAIPQGYLTYRLSAEDLREQPVGELVVEDLISVTDEARRALWAYAATFTQARTVRAVNVPVDEPLRWLLSDSRGLRSIGVRDFLWLRLVDVAAALSARGYGTHDRLVLEIHDAQLPANDGRYELTPARGTSVCARTDDEPDLRLDVDSLSAAYLGGTTMATLTRAGRVIERTRGAAVRADAMFASNPGPWTVTDW
jgi:predicted acetyltransferase